MAWLTIAGIGEDGIAGLGERARAAIGAAHHVFGGARHLDLADGLIVGERHVWDSPITASLARIEGLRGQRVCVLASGDPMLYGVGATLSRTIPAGEMEVFPAPSAFSLAAARLGWALQEVTSLSLHGRTIERIRPALQPGRRILALTSDEGGPAALAALLTGDGFGASGLIVLEALGGPAERIVRQRADQFALERVNRLNVCAIEVVAGADARVLPLTPGLADTFFEHDGQITKRPIRALTLSALAPRAGALLWDIGAGSGSISVEWMLADPSLRAIAVEADPERAARIRANGPALGVPDLSVVEGTAPAALAGLPRPDAVFVGGGGSAPGVMEAAMAALGPGGRLVANGVTLQMEAVLLALHAGHGGTLTRIALAEAQPVGTMTGWRPSMPITQWVWVKP